MGVSLANNAHTTLTSEISSVSTTINVADVSSFPTLGVGDYFYCTIESTSGTYEIVKVTQINSASFIVVRGQEGTIPVPFSAGSRVELRITVQNLEDFFQDQVGAEVADQIGVTIQAYDPQLTDFAGLTPSSGRFISGNGTNWAIADYPLITTSVSGGTEYIMKIGPTVSGTAMHEFRWASASDVDNNNLRPRYWNHGGIVSVDFGDGSDIAIWRGGGDYEVPAQVTGWSHTGSFYGTSLDATPQFISTQVLYSAADGQQILTAATGNWLTGNGSGGATYSVASVAASPEGYAVYAYNNTDVLNFGNWTLLTRNTDYTDDNVAETITMLTNPTKDRLVVYRLRNRAGQGPFLSRGVDLSMYTTADQTSYSRPAMFQIGVAGVNSTVNRPLMFFFGPDSSHSPRVVIPGRGTAADVANFRAIDSLNIDDAGSYYHRGVEATALNSFNPRRYQGSATLTLGAPDIANDYTLALRKTSDTDVGFDVGYEFSSGDLTIATVSGGTRTRRINITNTGIIYPNTDATVDFGKSATKWGTGYFTQLSSVPSTSVAAIHLHATDASYTSNVALFDADRAASSAFNFATWNANSVQVARLDGTGRFTNAVGGLPMDLVNNSNGSAVELLRLEGDRSAPTNGDIGYISIYMSSSTGVQREFGRFALEASDVTNASEDGEFRFYVMVNGTLTQKLQINNGAVRPPTNDGIALGGATLSFSDLFLASGGVINFNNGNATLTHSTGRIASNVPVGLPSYTVAGLPTGTAGDVAYASNGRKNGEGAGAGTGVMVFKDGTAWIACDTGAAVAA